MQQNTDQVWLRVFDGLAELAQLSWPSEGQVGQLNSLLGSVHMIQPFNWNAWEAPLPALHEIWGLSADDCVKHVTRLSRADRTNEGVVLAVSYHYVHWLSVHPRQSGDCLDEESLRQKS
jgi:hypothetical protein